MFRLLGVSYELQVSPIILMMQVLDITQEVRTAPWSNLRPLLLSLLTSLSPVDPKEHVC